MKNIAEILKQCPQGIKLYSPICGEVRYEEVDKEFDKSDPTIIVKSDIGGVFKFYSNGAFFVNGPCCLWPSEHMKDWEGFKPFTSPKFSVGDRIIDTVHKNGYVYEVLEVLEDRYRVTGFGTLHFYQQEEFELHPVQIEMVEPAKMYWFRWQGEESEPLLEKLMELSGSAYRPCNIKKGEYVYNNGSRILSGRCNGENPFVVFVGTELRIKNNKG